ncbi:hypothetical protein SDC9_166572 [bioreactor metagenome]|uniref:Uncharacterized protein n=1 Tax=bioreactor metagenome TaxID=1076179 RepID=A0A645FZ57_9ZZZZ
MSTFKAFIRNFSESWSNIPKSTSTPGTPPDTSAARASCAPPPAWRCSSSSAKTPCVPTSPFRCRNSVPCWTTKAWSATPKRIPQSRSARITPITCSTAPPPSTRSSGAASWCATKSPLLTATVTNRSTTRWSSPRRSRFTWFRGATSAASSDRCGWTSSPRRRFRARSKRTS